MCVMMAHNRDDAMMAVGMVNGRDNRYATLAIIRTP
jgi:hypothetical protein